MAKPYLYGYTSQPSVAIASVLSLQNYTFSGVQPNLRPLSLPASPLFYSIILDAHAKASIPDTLPHFCPSANSLPPYISYVCPSANCSPAYISCVCPSANYSPPYISYVCPSESTSPATFGASALFGLRATAHHP